MQESPIATAFCSDIDEVGYTFCSNVFTNIAHIYDSYTQKSAMLMQRDVIHKRQIVETMSAVSIAIVNITNINMAMVTTVSRI